MKSIDIITLFPEVCHNFLHESIIGRAVNKGLLAITTHQLRDYSTDRLRRVDDTPYGGGKGMLIQAEPLANACKAVMKEIDGDTHIIYMSPKGTVLNQQKAIELSQMDKSLIIVCGHYDGVDQRFINQMVDEEISIGDYVLTGGELGAMVLTDAVGRLVPGVLSDASCYEDESHHSGLLEYPHYTRPFVWQEESVLELLISGHHANIDAWRREISLALTATSRPDMLEMISLTKKDINSLEGLKKQNDGDIS